MNKIPSDSIDLIVTSPPYPMIQMWDTLFSDKDETIDIALKKGEGQKAFELMHRLLDPVWNEAYRVLKSGGFACINIGDAVRTLHSDFAIYSNHTRILWYLLQIGFTALPAIIWRKQTNAPNKFMGSGMLPAGAYVTLEHEYVLILRKGGKRIFTNDSEKQNRRQSAIFWEERNQYFSDIWFDIKGSRQELNDKELRKRSAAFPFELAYRLINMYSVKNDVVLDPFMGTGTTLAAAMTAARNSMGCEIEKGFLDSIMEIKNHIIRLAGEVIETRLNAHLSFIAERITAEKSVKHRNLPYGFPVMTLQEKELLLNELTNVTQTTQNSLKAVHSEYPRPDFHKNELLSPSDTSVLKKKTKIRADTQLELF
ncbi:MAG: modification methylase [Desulfobacula sp. RIFOXYB2_FULL_45_6]|nr:MAG: modification methylase [Desulfobacula sp. RIFOXYB2_FULL_45_6]